MQAGDTPLIDAARDGRVADVTALLADGADVNERTFAKGAAIIVACAKAPRCPKRFSDGVS